MLAPLFHLIGLVSTQTESIERVWQNALDKGFQGGAIVVSNDQIRYFESPDENLPKNLKIGRNTRMPICSVTKAMTSEVILGLVSEGKLRLDGSLGSYLPWIPEYAKAVTIQKLLTHTSGLPNMDKASGVDADGIPKIYRSFDPNLRALRPRILKLLGESAASQPGSKYDYNNTDFIVLQAVAEAVTGKSFQSLLQDQIFAPADMKSSHLANWKTSSKEFVDCFRPNGGAPTPLPRFNMAIYGGAAGVISTPADLGKWMRFTLSSSTGMSLLKSGSKFGGFQGYGGYAYRSKFLKKDSDELVYERPGAVNGYGLQITFLPERNLAVAAFSNREGEGEELGNLFQGSGLVPDLIAAASQR